MASLGEDTTKSIDGKGVARDDVNVSIVQTYRNMHVLHGRRKK